MAPGTNPGAATPVQIGGGLPLPGGSPPEDPNTQEPDAQENERQDEQRGEEAEPAEAPLPKDAMGRKIVNDAVAYIRSLAELRGRNADWAERAVRQAASLPARDAPERQGLDFVADSVSHLLVEADCRTSTVCRLRGAIAQHGKAAGRK